MPLPPNNLRAAGPDVIRITGVGEPLQITAAEGEGKPARFSMIAYTGVAMQLDGFYHPVVVDLAGMSVPSQTVPILRQHDANKVVGHTESVETLATKLKASGVISGSGADAAEVLSTAGKGFPWQASIGASIQRREFVEAGATVKVNGQTFTGPLVVARATTLKEISTVAIGADGQTKVAISASAGENMPTFEQFVTARGFDPANMSDAQRASMRAWYDKELNASGNTEKPGDALSKLIEETERENRRQDAITAMVSRLTAADPRFIDRAKVVAQTAIREKWTVERTELELYKARMEDNTSRVVAGAGNPSPVASGRVLEAALCQAGGLTNLERHYDEQTLQAAHTAFKGRIGLGEFFQIAARQHGHDSMSFRSDMSNALRAAFDVRASVGRTIIDVSGILSNTANKFLREGFLAVDMAWSKIAAKRNVSDFKAITVYTMTGDNIYEKVAPGGELKHGEAGEETYTNQADTYGKLIGLDRRDLINDDLGALTGVGKRLGRGAALKINDVFWTEFLDNSSFFTSGRGNYTEGAATNLQLSSLDTVYALFMNQTDPDGKPLGSMPKFLLVPTALGATAKTLVSATLINQTPASNAAAPNTNPWQGMFEVVATPYLSNSSYTGYSTTAWYMLADPNDLAVIEVCFLNGVETPTIETADMDFSRLGIALRGYHDFGVNKQEYRGGCKSKGAA